MLFYGITRGINNKIRRHLTMRIVPICDDLRHKTVDSATMLPPSFSSQKIAVKASEPRVILAKKRLFVLFFTPVQIANQPDN